MSAETADGWRDPARVAAAKAGVAAARERLLVTRVGAMYRCVCGYENVSLTAVELHRTRACAHNEEGEPDGV